MKWLEDELELNALHNPGSRRGNGNEKAAVSQRAALSAALGGRVEVAAMSSISGQLTSLSSFPPSLVWILLGRWAQYQARINMM